MKSEESARGEGSSIILFIRVLTCDYDTQIFSSGPRDTRDFLSPKVTARFSDWERPIMFYYIEINLGAAKKDRHARNYIILFNTKY